MEKIKKGTGSSPAPNMQEYYNKISNYCLALALIALIIFLAGYLRNSSSLQMFGAGMQISSLIIHFVLNPIEDEEEDEEDGC